MICSKPQLSENRGTYHQSREREEEEQVRAPVSDKYKAGSSLVFLMYDRNLRQIFEMFMLKSDFVGLCLLGQHLLGIHKFLLIHIEKL